MKIPKRWKKVSHRSYVFGDFDRDKIKNIDDPKPFKKNIKTKQNVPHKSVFIGGEIKLSDELRAWQKWGNTHIPMLKRFLQKNPESEGRIKTVPSTMKKMREDYGYKIGDIAGVRILTKDYPEVRKTITKMKRKHKTIKRYERNYYKKPKNKIYYAHHLSIAGRNKKRMELQIKTKRESELQDKMHRYYKLGMSPRMKRRYIKKSRRLAKEVGWNF